MAVKTAHLDFGGGGLIVPARTPYDRQLLKEHVLASVQQRRKIRLAVSGKTWLIVQADGECAALCTVCQRPINHAVCYEHAAGGAPSYCVACALG